MDDNSKETHNWPSTNNVSEAEDDVLTLEIEEIEVEPQDQPAQSTEDNQGRKEDKEEPVSKTPSEDVEAKQTKKRTWRERIISELKNREYACYVVQQGRGTNPRVPRLFGSARRQKKSPQRSQSTGFNPNQQQHKSDSDSNNGVPSQEDEDEDCSGMSNNGCCNNNNNCCCRPQCCCPQPQQCCKVCCPQESCCCQPQSCCGQSQGCCGQSQSCCGQSQKCCCQPQSCCCQPQNCCCQPQCCSQPCCSSPCCAQPCCGGGSCCQQGCCSEDCCCRTHYQLCYPRQVVFYGGRWCYIVEVDTAGDDCCDDCCESCPPKATLQYPCGRQAQLISQQTYCCPGGNCSCCPPKCCVQPCGCSCYGCCKPACCSSSCC